MKSLKFFQFHCSSNVLLLEDLDHFFFRILVCCTRVLLRLHQHESILEITALIRGIGTQYHQCWGIYIVLYTCSSILFVCPLDVVFWQVSILLRVFLATDHLELEFVEKNPSNI